MKKIWIALLSTLCLALGGFFFSACTIQPESVDESACEHRLEYHAAVAATCTSDGSVEYWSCSECGKYYSDENGKTEISTGSVVVGKTEHHYTDETTAATCTEAGRVVWTCEFCHDTYTETIPATGHTEEVLQGKAPTCTETGLTDGKKCSVCGTVTVEQTVIPATGHTEEVLQGKAPTCTETGLTDGKKCSVCDTVTVEQTVIPATGHTEEVIQGKAPTCNETGLTEGKKCSVCGTVTVEQTVIPATGHTESEWKIDKAATCTETGSKHTECTVCGTTVKTEIIAKIAHTEEVIAGKAATCTETGLTEGKKCSVCGEVLSAQEEIAKIAHTEETIEGKAATCTETGLTEGKKCSVCGTVTVEQTVIPATGHTESEWKVDKAATCTETGSKHTECTVCGTTMQTDVVPLAAHTEETVAGKAATCTETGLTEGKKCSVCGTVTVEQTEIRATGHTEGEWITDKAATCTETGSKHTECTVCGTTMQTESVPLAAHTEETIAGKAATCTDTGLTEGKKCSVCGTVTVEQTVIPALGHDYEVSDEKSATCTADGYTEYTCSRCGDTHTDTIEATGHDYEETVVPATCTTDGYTEHTCKVCDDTYTDNVVKAAGHVYEETVVPSTCTTDGYTEHTCKVCDDTYTDNVVKAAGHTFNDALWTVKSSAQEGCILTVTEENECTVCHEIVEREHKESKHTYVGTISTPATCSEEGLTTYRCSVCEDTGKEPTVIAKNDNHAWNEGVLDEGTGVTTYTCNDCGATKTTFSATDKTETNIDGAAVGAGEVALKDATIAMDEETQNSIKDVENLSISANKLTDEEKGNLSQEAQATIGDAPVYDFNLTQTVAEEEGGTKKVVFNGKMTITVPYELKEGEDPESVVVYFIADDGTLSPMNATYYVANGQGYATFTTDHFSYYTVVRLTAAETCALYGHKEYPQGKPASCTEDGYTVTICTRCGETLVEKQIIPALDHDYKIVVTAPTCTTSGYTTYTCKRCGDTYRSDYTDALTHDYEGKVTAPTCTKMGYTTYTCKRCAHSYKSDYVSATGHNYEVSEELSFAPTCTASGVKTEVCAECGAQRKSAIPATGHKYEIEEIKATCTTGGYKVYTCSVCDDSYVSNYTSAAGHKYETNVIAPTCTTGGYTVYTCSVCDDTYNGNYTLPTGHDYEETVTAPTCTAGGYTTYTCKACDDSYVSDYTAAAGHRYEANVTAPTCTTGGYTTYTCSVCGDSYRSDYTAAAGHDYEANVTAPTCTTGGYTTYTCKDCGESYVGDYTAAAGHKYVANVIAPTCTVGGYTEYTCSVCGEKKTGDYTSATGHNYVDGVCTSCGDGCTHVFGEYVSNHDATCTHDGTKSATCAVCGYVSTVTDGGTKLEHNYTSQRTEATCTAEGKIVYTCTACGESYFEIIPKTEHDYAEERTEATCTSDGKITYTCTVCGKVRIEAIAKLGHDYVMTETAPTCTEDGAKVYTCSRCDDSYSEKIERLGHDYVMTETAPTCTEDGAKVYTCSRCEDSYSEKIERLGHDYVMTETAPTCTEDGAKVYTCSRCEDGYSEAIPATGHSYEDGVCTVCGEEKSKIGYYTALIESLFNCEKVSIKLENFAFNYTYEEGSEVYRCELAELMLGLDENGNLYGKGKGTVTATVNGYAVSVEIKAILKDGVLYFAGTQEAEGRLETVNGEIMVIDAIKQALNLPITEEQLTAEIERYEECIKQALALIEAVYAQNAGNMENALGRMIEGLFTREETENGYVLYLDFEKLIAFNDLLYEQTVTGVIDELFGEGASEKVYDYVISIADKKVAEVVDQIIDFADGYGLEIADVYALIENVVYTATGQEISVDEIVRQFYDLTVNELIAQMMPQGGAGEEKPVETPEYVYDDEGNIIGEKKSESPTSEEDQTENFDYTMYVEQVYDMLSQYTVYQMICAMSGVEPSNAENIYNGVNNVIGLIKEHASLVVTTDKSGNVLSVALAANELQLPQGGVTVDGSLTVTPDGDITVDFEDLPEEVKALFERIEFAEGESVGEWTVVRDADGKLQLVRTYCDKMEQPLEDLVEYNGVQYRAVLVYYHSYHSYTVDWDTFLTAVVLSDCGDWKQYSYTVKAFCEERNGCFIEYYDAEGNPVACEPFNAEIAGEKYFGYVESYSTTTGVYFFYNVKTGEYASSSQHKYVEDESQRVEPVGCEGKGKRVYICSECGNSYESPYTNGHKYEQQYVLAEGSESCEDGVLERTVCTVCGKVEHEEKIYGHRMHWETEKIETDCGVIVIESCSCVCGQESSVNVFGDGCKFEEETDKSGEKNGERYVYRCMSCGYVYSMERVYESSECEYVETVTYRFGVTGEDCFGEEYDKIISYTKTKENHYIKEEVNCENDEEGRVIRRTVTYVCQNCEKIISVVTYTYSYDMTEKGQIVSVRSEKPETGYWREETRTYTSLCEYKSEVTDSYGKTYDSGGSSHQFKEEYVLAEGSETCDDGVIERYVCSFCGYVNHENPTYGHRYERKTIVKGDDYGLYEYGCVVCGKSSDDGLEYYGFDFEEVEGEDGVRYEIYTSSDQSYVFICKYETVNIGNCAYEEYRSYYFNVTVDEESEEITYERKTDPVLYNRYENHSYKHTQNSYIDDNGNRVEVHMDTCSVCGRGTKTTSAYGDYGQVSYEYVVNGEVIESWYKEYFFDEEGNATGYDRYEGETLTASYIFHNGREYKTYELTVEKYATYEYRATYYFEQCYYEYTEIHTYYDEKTGEKLNQEENSGTKEVHTFIENRTLLGESCEDGVRVENICLYCSANLGGYEYSYHETHLIETHTVSTDCGKNVITEYGCLCGENRYLNTDFACEMDYLTSVSLENGHRVEVYRCAVTDCAYTYSREHYTVYDKENCTATDYEIYRFGIAFDDENRQSSCVSDDCDLIIRFEGRSYEWHVTHNDGNGNYICENCEKTIEIRYYRYDDYGRIIEEYYENTSTGYWWRNVYEYDAMCTGTKTYTNSNGEENSYPFENHLWNYGDFELNCTEYGYIGEYCFRCGETSSYEFVEPSHDYVWNEELGTYVCTRCGLENETGVDGNFLMEDKSDEYNYVLSFFNREYIVGGGAYEIIIELVSGEETYVIGGTNFETVTLNEQEYDGVIYGMNLLQKSGKITLFVNEVSRFVEVLGLTDYNLRISFLYNDWDGGSYLQESMTFEKKTDEKEPECAHEYDENGVCIYCGAEQPQETECKHEWKETESKVDGCKINVVYVCDLCGKTRTETTEKHTFEAIVSEDGIEIGVCCTVCGREELYETECAHEYVGEVTIEATCEKEGVMLYACKLCGESYEESLPVTEHEYGEDGVCVTCGNKLTEESAAA